MKKMILATVLLSAISHAEETKSIENRVRNLGESVVSVTACSQPQFDARDYQAYVYNQDGTIRQKSNGELMTKLMTQMTATSTFSFTSCQTNESYKVEVTSKSLWSSTEAEVANSGVQSSQLVSKEINGSNTQEVDVKALMNSVNTGGFFNQDSRLEVLETIKQGIMTKAVQECEAKRAQVAARVVNVSTTSCH